MLDFIRDLYASFKQTSLERVKSPVLGAFVFSWIGFNWKILAILFFSKDPIEKRIIYIDQNFDIFLNLLGTISITILICTFLPIANKLVTRIQDKPNTDTIRLKLTSQIKIAKHQQRIAEIEARKKLAEKKEDKFIDNQIYQMKEENIRLKREIETLNENISTLNTSLNQSYVTENHYKEISDKAEATINGLRAQINELVNAERKLKEELIKKENDISNMAVKLTNFSEQIVQLTNEIDRKNEENANMKANINLQDEKVKLLVKTYPRYFTLLPTSGIPSLEITHNLIKDYMNEKESMNDNQNSSI
ncbi:hypothetical protein QSI24_06955 [Klebsiella quasipneumoniae]|uniref:hypothetical protein n=1 Tax=Klebsiella quasipneumoniae TaxID=1463165 RepID=UPI00256F2B1A|nr:hypothetical protein [Klebsiella quasipneumoniae]MDL5478942.1 hypothetical protein [Klebsiella quasipneumoniae]